MKTHPQFQNKEANFLLEIHSQENLYPVAKRV